MRSILPETQLPGISGSGTNQSGNMDSACGFTLLELLVALAVFGLAALALLNLSGQNSRSIGIVQERVLARIVAQNQAAEAALLVVGRLDPRAGGEENQGGVRFVWVRTVSPTPDPKILRVLVAVRSADSPQVLSEITLFRERL